MKLKLSLIVLACVLSSMFLTGCGDNTDKGAPPASTNAMPKTN